MADKQEKQELSQEEYEKLVYKDGDSLVVDLSNVQEMKFEVIPKGNYIFEVDDVTFVPESANSGFPMFEFTMRVADGEYTGRKLKYWTSFSPKALSGSKTALLNLDSDLFNGAFSPEEVAASGKLMGKQIRGKVDIGDYQGREVNRIAYLLPLNKGGDSDSGKGGFFKNAG